MKIIPRLEHKYVTIGAVFFGLIFSLPGSSTSLQHRHLSRLGLTLRTSLGSFLYADPLPSVSILEPLQMWRDSDASQPAFANSDAVFLPALLFGPWIGLHLEIPSHLAIAWSGAYLLARCQRFGVAGSIICASIFAGSSRAPTILIINQSYYPSWQLIEGLGHIFPYNGLLAVGVPAGNHALTLRYRDRAFVTGAATSATTLLIGLMVMMCEREASPTPRPGRHGYEVE
jgi:hypothetical protein